MRSIRLALCCLCAAARLVINVTAQQQCPSWLASYEAFHASMRGQPSAKYLVHEVLGDGEAGGLGDRLRSMLFTLRYAYALNRVVLFTWRSPYEVTNFLQPAGKVNWTLDGIPREQGKLLAYSIKPHPDTLSSALAEANDTFITLRTNIFMDGKCFNCPEINAWGPEASCLWHRTFRINEDIEQMASGELAKLYETPTPRYAAVHLRLGHLIGENYYIEQGRTQLQSLMVGLSCAKTAAGKNNITSKILVVTDNTQLRKFLQAGILDNVVTPAGLPTHLDRAPDQALEAHKHTFVDLIVLGRSHCLITSKSGFNHHAWLYGGAKPCHKNIAQCPEL